MKKPSINFVMSAHKNYTGVQDQLSGLISKYLPTDRVSSTKGDAREGAFNVTFFIQRPGEVVMSHGVADKNYLFRKTEEGGRWLHGFKHAFVPGPRLKRRLTEHPAIEMPSENIHIVGWPRMDLLLELQREAKREPNGRIKVLWAPTHDRRRDGTTAYSSYPLFEEHLPALQELFDVEVSLHPRNRKKKRPTSEQLAEADVVISDFGTMVYEALALGTPVLFPDWLIRKGILKRFPKQSGPGQLFHDDIGLHPRSFDEMVDTIRTRPQVDARSKAFIDDVLSPELRGKSAKTTAKTLLRLSKEA